jgi:PilZ domain
MTLRNIILERREKTRKVPDDFAFLQLEQDDGGKVVDISEGGLRFESFAPVREEPNPIHFWFSLNLRERIEGWGELAWTAAEGKSGGLKFLRLAEGGREQIRDYLDKSSPQKIPTKTGAPQPDAVATFVSRARPQTSTLFSPKQGPREASIPFPAAAASPASGMLVPMERHLSALRRQLIIGLTIGASVAAILTFAAFKFSQYLGEHRATTKPAVEVPAQPDPQNSSPAVARPSAGGPTTDVFAIPKQKKSASSVLPPATPTPDSAVHSHLPKTPMPPDQLWTMVQAGNSAAAAALAELYIKGEGVPQSCAQARVLLLVASEKRNASAIKRLAELDKEGCPAN